MDMTEAKREWAFWEGLSNEGRALNTEGDPPYNASYVAGRLLMALIHPDIPDGPILDLGCGTGRLTVEMAETMTWREFVAVDISQRMLAYTKARLRTLRLGNVATFPCDGRTLPVGPELAGAYSIAMFQHIPHDAQAAYIAQVAERLQPRGRFVFTVAVGSVDERFNHQIPARPLLDGWCDAAGMAILWVDHDDPQTGWTWVVAERRP